MNHEELYRYQRNKNIVLEPGERAGFLRRARRRLAHYISPGPAPVRPVFSERIVEYPLLFSYLGPAPQRILDFGCVEDLFPLHLCSLGHRVTGLDFRPYPFEHPDFDFIQADILTWKAPEGAYDTVISVSTVEHVGLTYYGDPEEPEGDRRAVEKLWTALSPGGRLLLTVPAGPPQAFRGMRVYDETGIRDLVPGIEVLRFFGKDERGGAWREIEGSAVTELPYDVDEEVAPALGVAFVLARKRSE